MDCRLAVMALLFTVSPSPAAESKPKLLASGLKNPSAVCIGPDGRTYVAVMGETGRDGDGGLVVIVDGKATPFASGLDDPSGIVVWNNMFFVADKTRIWRVDRAGKAVVHADAKAFPTPPQFLNDITVDQRGMLYVSDSGDNSAGAIFRVPQKGKPERVASEKLKSPHGLTMDGMSHLLVTDETGAVQRLRLSDGTIVKLGDTGRVNSVAWDWRGRLFLGTQDGAIFAAPRPGEPLVRIASGFGEVGGICPDAAGRELLVVDAKANTLSSAPMEIPGQAVDESQLPVVTAPAFPALTWTGWEPTDKTGKPSPLRPILLTHAGDGSNRVFVPTQHGVVHVFPNTDAPIKTKIFFDWQSKVRYDDRTNEEGFLGMAFHPNYKSNGEFFIFYTDKKATLTNVVSRMRVSKDDPDRADPASEEELLRIPHKFWNHDGGTICFGPDGYLYIALGDGGAANDPFGNGQDLKSILGKVLRIDVNNKGDGKPYAIPKDNPFVGRSDAAPEVYAYGLRNIWRMAFDRPTGKLWAADVGQDLYEEIDIIEKGGNYGWNVREGFHPFGANGASRRPDLIEPIWEYHHDIGKSMTGGMVYRGKKIPVLDGWYVYGDYLSMKIWALKYDEKQKRVVGNRPIPDPNVPIMSFGEDETGEIYLLTFTATGQGIHRFVKAPTPTNARQNGR